MKEIKLLFLLTCLVNVNYAQNKLLDSLIQNNYYTFGRSDASVFKGKGWEILIDEIDKSNSVLLGETHFTNEIPSFVSAIVSTVKFDNYFQEIDPFSTKAIESKIKSLPSEKLDEFVRGYSSNFSFLEIKQEFDLYKKIVQNARWSSSEQF